MKIAILMAGAALAVAAPASAKISVIAQNVDFSTTPFTFGVTPEGSFTLSFDSRGSFDPSPVLASTSGNAQVVTVFGAPSVAFTDPPTTFGPNSFPGFSAVPTPGRVAFSLTASDLGLRYGTAGNYFYGYARFANSNLERVAFQSVANVGILAGAVPEPSTWALLIIGFGGIGGAMRYRRGKQAVRYA